MADALDDLGRTDEATEWIRKATEWSPERIDLALLLATRYLRGDEPGEAIRLLTPITRAHPENQTALEVLGEAYWNRFASDDSPADRTAAIEAWNQIAPGPDPSANNLLRVAQILRQHQLEPESLDAYERASAADRASIEILGQWADWLFALDRPDEAWAVLDRITATPEQQTPDRFLRLAQIQKKFGGLETAVDSADHGLALDPDSFDLLSLKWSILAELKRWEEAANLYEDLARTAPNEFFRQSVDQRHIEALAASEQIESVRDQLASRLGNGSLAAGELGLLLQISTTTREVEISARTLAEIESRFPESVRLREIALAHQIDRGELDAAVQTLATLQQLAPNRRDEWLQQTAEILRSAYQMKRAIAAAEKRVELAPADIDARLYLAALLEEAGLFDQAIDSLRSALSLADNPAPARQRLVELFSLLARTGDAYEEAWNLFREEDSLADRLNRVPLLTDLALQLGRLDDLINDFERKRMSEENGYRYALFLASIYETIGDLGSARENLIEALAARPDDPILLGRILAMAKQENHWEDYARFSREIAESDPTPENLLTHLEALFRAERPEEALAWLRTHREVFLGEINELRSLISNQDEAAAEVFQLFGRSLRQQDGDPAAQIALGELLLLTGDFQGAEETFWRVFQMRAPQAAPVAANPTSASPGGIQTLFSSGPFNQRLNASRSARSEARSLIFDEGSNRNHSHHVVRINPNPTGSGSTFEQQQDRALIYLAALAVRDNRADPFLAQLDSILDQRADPLRARMIVYSLLDEKERAGEAAEALLAEDGLDRAILREIQAVWLRDAFARTNPNDPEEISKSLDWLTTLQQKLAAVDPQAAKPLDLLRLNFLLRSQQIEEAKALADEILAESTPDSPLDFQLGFSAIRISGQYERLGEWLDAYLKSPSLRQSFGPHSHMTVVSMLYSPLAGYGLPSGIPQPESEEAVELVLQNLRTLWASPHYSPQPTHPQPNYYGHRGGALTFPGENGWVSNMELHFLQRSAQSMAAKPEAADAFARGLAEIADDLDGEKSIPPLLTLALWQQFRGKPEETARIARDLALRFPRHQELQFAAALALLATNDHEAALAAVESTRPQTFADRKTRLMIKMQCLTRLERRAEAEAAVNEFFASRRLSSGDHQLRNLLSQLNLDPHSFQGPTASRGQPSTARALRSNDWNQISNVLNRMRELEKKGEDEEAMRIAEMILAHDPVRSQRNNESHLRDRALEIYLKKDRLPGIRATLEEQLAAAPKSAFLHFRLAELALKAKARRSDAGFAHGEYVEKLLSLRPDDTALQLYLANLLSGARDYALAAEIYLTVLQNDPGAAIQSNAHTIVRAFIQTDQTDVLLDFVNNEEFIRKVSLNNQWGLSNFLQQIGNQLENEDRPVEALRFRRLALDYLDWNNRLNQIESILDLQIQLGELEEARETLWSAVFAEDDPAPDTNPRFGFQQTNTHRQSLFSQISFNNSMASIRGVRLLNYADRLGLNERLLAWASEDHPSWVSDYDAAAIRTLVRIAQRDPLVLEEFAERSGDVELLLQPSMSVQRHYLPFLTNLADELARWEEAGDTAFDLYVETINPAATASFGNPYHDQLNTNTKIRNVIRLIELADSEEKRETARESLGQAIEAVRIALVSPQTGNLSRQLITQLLSRAFRENVLDTEARQEWIDRIRSLSAWGGEAETAANYLQLFAGNEPNRPFYPALDEEGQLLPMAIVSLRPDNPNRSDPVYLVTPGAAANSDPLTLYATADPTMDPITINPEEGDLSETLARSFPDGFGYVFLGGPHEDPTTASRDRWSPISLRANLIAEPDPTRAAFIADTPTDPMKREGWQQLPPQEMVAVTFPAGSPIRHGNQIPSSGNNSQETILSEPIPLAGENQPDLLLSAWFRSSDGSNNSAYANLGLRFLDENGGKIRDYSTSTRIPYDDLWSHLSALYTASKSDRNGRSSYRNNSRYVQVKIDVRPGIVFGGLHLSAIPQPAAAESANASQLLRDSFQLADEGSDPARVADLYLEALRTDPNQAVGSYRANDAEWVAALQASGRLGEIFTFLARPDVHNRESFRYYRKSVNARSDLLAIAELALADPDVDGATALLDLILTGQTQLTPAQMDRLQLAARAAGVADGNPAEDLARASRILGLTGHENRSPTSPSVAVWSGALEQLEQLELLEEFRAQLTGRPDDPAGAAEVALIEAWILARLQPNQASEVLKEMADGYFLSDSQTARAAAVLGRIASSDSGIPAARSALIVISNSISGDEAQRARFRFQALDQFATARSEPSPALLESVREAEIEWLCLDPSDNSSRLMERLQSLVIAEDYVAALPAFQSGLGSDESQVEAASLPLDPSPAGRACTRHLPPHRPGRSPRRKRRTDRSDPPPPRALIRSGCSRQRSAADDPPAPARCSPRPGAD